MSEIAIQAEQALLGACIINAEVVDIVDGAVARDDFAEPLHARLFEAIVAAKAEGRRVDTRLLQTILGSEYQGGDLTAYLAKLVHDTPTIVNAPDYARVVRERADYRRLMAVAETLKTESSAGHQSGSPAEIASSVVDVLDGIVTSRAPAGNRRVSLSEASRMAIARSEEARSSGRSVSGVTWGLRDLNAATLGLHPGHLVILAARPSMGKSTMGLAVARAAAKAKNGVLFVSLEMVGEDLAERALADECFDHGDPIPYISIRSGDLTDAEVGRLSAASERLSPLPMMIEQQAGLTVGQIGARARSLASRMERQGTKLRLLVVDHLGLVRASDRYAGSRHSELGEITTSLKALAKELGVAVLLLCQLNRALEGRDNKRPGLSDLRESGRIEEDADAVLFLYREAYYLERLKVDDPEKDADRTTKLLNCQNRMEIIIAKQRQGPTKTIDAYVSMPCNAIRDMDRRY